MAEFKASEPNGKKPHDTRAPHKAAFEPRNKRRKGKRAEVVIIAALTPEQQTKVDAEKKAAEAAAKAEAERLEAYVKAVPKMSFKQLRGELRRKARGGDAFAVVLSTVLENTKTKQNPFATLSCYVR
jgi:hypothetical protein